MVQLQKCLVVVATRVKPADGSPQGEMATVNFFDLKFDDPKHMFGHVRHECMGDGRQTLSSCILSTEELREAKKPDNGDLDLKVLDDMWAGVQRDRPITLNLGSTNTLPFLKVDIPVEATPTPA